MKSKQYVLDLGAIGTIKITLVPQNGKMSGSIESTLKEPSPDPSDGEAESDYLDVALHNARIDGMEATLLALAVAGVDLSAPFIKDAVLTALEGIANAE